MNKPAEGKELIVNINYEMFVLALVVLSLINWGIIVFIQPALAEIQVVWVMITGLSVFLVLDFVTRLWRQPHRRGFLIRNNGWMILLGSVPLPFAGILRLIWAWLAVRLLRRSDYREMRNIVVRRRAQSTLLSAVLAAIIMLEIGALLILDAERASTQANIITGIDALWWNIVTLATVGYGDKYPVTTAGRVIGVGVIVVGVGLFSALTSFLAQWFLRSRAADNQTQVTASPELQALDQLTVLLRTYDVQQLLADTQRPPAEVLAELRQKVAEINTRGE
ncbi:MAG: two pore domain potassium channel family protein [Chloroflexi bacterium]|nr:two pore domain potassium channel family protein [Chloroflexota bacterium]